MSHVQYSAGKGKEQACHYLRLLTAINHTSAVTLAHHSSSEERPPGPAGAINKVPERCQKGAICWCRRLNIWFDSSAAQVRCRSSVGTARNDDTDVPLRGIMLTNGNWKRTETLGALGRLATLGGAAKLAQEEGIWAWWNSENSQGFQTSRTGGKQQQKNIHGIFSAMKIPLFFFSIQFD